MARGKLLKVINKFIPWVWWWFHRYIQFSSVAQLCLTLCDPMNHSTPGLPVYHQLPEFTLTHVHWVGDAISHLILCHPLLLPQSLPASESFPMSQLFPCGGQSTGVSALTSFPPKKSQGWLSRWTGWISLQSRDSQESSPTPQFKSINPSALSFLHSLTLFIFFFPYTSSSFTYSQETEQRTRSWLLREEFLEWNGCTNASPQRAVYRNTLHNYAVQDGGNRAMCREAAPRAALQIEIIKNNTTKPSLARTPSCWQFSSVQLLSRVRLFVTP